VLPLQTLVVYKNESTRNVDTMTVVYVSDGIVIYPNVIPHKTVKFLHRLTIFEYLVSLYVELNSFITIRFRTRPVP